MEVVRGVSITEHCDNNNLTTRQRLELFIDVCRAVQHAHQKGIIHRDVKPTNVLGTLIDGRPVPKVIDFSIAKATRKQLTEKTFFTGDGQFLGTPQYMSPEQAEFTDVDVDTRTDVYSLGVLLYVSDVNLAYHAWQEGKANRARELLSRHVPQPGDQD